MNHHFGHGFLLPVSDLPKVSDRRVTLIFKPRDKVLKFDIVGIFSGPLIFRISFCHDTTVSETYELQLLIAI